MFPKLIKLKKKNNLLLLGYTDSEHTLSAEYLRIMSPSAEVRGHMANQAQLQVGKMHVKLQSVQTVGHYALKLVFDDGHDSGIYTWQYLRDLCVNFDPHWQTYLASLAAAKKSRDPYVSIVNIME